MNLNYSDDSDSDQSSDGSLSGSDSPLPEPVAIPHQPPVIILPNASCSTDGMRPLPFDPDGSILSEIVAPMLHSWRRTERSTIVGLVVGSPGFKNGQCIETAVILAQEGGPQPHVRTSSGSVYLLGLASAQYPVQVEPVRVSARDRRR